VLNVQLEANTQRQKSNKRIMLEKETICRKNLEGSQRSWSQSGRWRKAVMWWEGFVTGLTVTRSDGPSKFSAMFIDVPISEQPRC